MIATQRTFPVASAADRLDTDRLGKLEPQDLRCLRNAPDAVRTPAIQDRFSRFRGTVQQDPVARQETQIVQSCM